MGFFDVLNGLISDIAGGVSGVFTGSDPVTCACCKKCYYDGANCYCQLYTDGPIDINSYPRCECVAGTFEAYNPDNPGKRRSDLPSY